MIDDFTQHTRGLIAAVVMRSIDDYKIAVGYLYQMSGTPNPTTDQRRAIYETVRIAEECEQAIVDYARSIFCLDGTKFMAQLKAQLFKKYEGGLQQ